jgi:sugar lactone lactonase YvrE
MNGSTPVLQPFPSWEMQTIGNFSALQYVQSMEISNDRMWILDVGRLNIMDDPSLIVNGAPKLVIYNLVTNVVERTFVFPNDVAYYDSSFLNDIVIDETRGVAYISDTSGDGAIIVYDYTSNQARRWTGPGTALEPNTVFTINGINYTNIQAPSDGIALNPDASTVYYCPLTGYHLWSLPASTLRDFSMSFADWNASLTSAAIDHGEKASQSDGMAFSDKGILYFGLLSMNGINSWDPRKALSTQAAAVVPNDETLQWVDTSAWDDKNGYLVFVSNRLARYFAKTMDYSGAEGANHRIGRSHVGAKSYLAGQKASQSPTTCDRCLSLPFAILTVLVLAAFIGGVFLGNACQRKKKAE